MKKLWVLKDEGKAAQEVMERAVGYVTKVARKLVVG